MGALWGMRVVCEAKAKSWAQILVQTSLHGGQERGNFLLHGMARIHLSAPKITLCATYVLKIP